MMSYELLGGKNTALNSRLHISKATQFNKKGKNQTAMVRMGNYFTGFMVFINYL